MSIKSRVLPVLIILTACASVGAADQVVSDCADSGGANQLRQKLADAQSSGGGTITFTCGPNIVVDSTKGALNVTGNVTIDGNHAMEISGGNATRIFLVNSTATLTLNRITISFAKWSSGDGGAVRNNGGTLNVTNSKFLNNATSADWSGGAIYSTGPLHIIHSEFASNTGGGGAVKPSGSAAVTTISNSYFHENQSLTTGNTGYGGAIQAYDATDVTVTNSLFDANIAFYGGAIYVQGSATMHVNGCTFSANHNGLGFGGGIYTDGSTIVTGSAFNNNQAAQGGGVFVNSTGSLDVSTTAFDNNKCNSGSGVELEAGGGIYNLGSLTVTNVTLSNNDAPLAGGILNSGTAQISATTISGNHSGYGASGSTYPQNEAGGLANTAGTLTVTNCTISGNIADGQAGGLFNQAAATLINVTFKNNSLSSGANPSYAGGIYNLGTNLSMTNTIIAKGARGTNCGGDPVTGSVNLADDSTCGFSGIPDLLLGPLANNGGFTKTHMPQPQSIAVDGGTSSGAPPTDQRDVIRPQGQAVDVGAVEYLPLVQNGSAYVQYDGWRGFLDNKARGGSYRMSKITGDMVTFEFKGTSIQWVTRKAPAMGSAAVTIDGVSHGTFDLYNSTVLWNQTVSFANLPTGSHTIVVRVTGTKNPSATDFNVALDGFLVGNSTTAVQDTSLAVQYNSWIGNAQEMASGDSLRISGKLGAVARFNFHGTSITFVTARGPAYGMADVLIDGVLKSSNLNLYAATQQWQYAIDYSGLTNTDHTIEIRPKHTKGANSSGFGVVVDAFTGPFTALP
jgi:hypothetical protein